MSERERSNEQEDWVSMRGETREDKECENDIRVEKIHGRKNKNKGGEKKSKSDKERKIEV